jgi:tetratricopeptide (TPR) repeat protein
MAAVDIDHLMAQVDQQRNDGNAAYKAGRSSDALAAWQRGLDAIAAAEGLQMQAADVPTVLRARSVLHSNRGQALVKMEFWARAVKDLTEAVRIDPANAKAIWRRYQARRKLKDWAAAEADLAALLAPELQVAAGPLLKGAGLGPEQLATTRAELQQLQREADAEADETFEDRMEEAAHKGIEALRFRFDEVIKRNGLHGNKELSAELADMLTRPGGATVGHVAAVYQIDEDDAEVLLDWVQKACMMQSELSSGPQSLDVI